MIRCPGYTLNEINSKVQLSPWAFSLQGRWWEGNEVCVFQNPKEQAPSPDAAGGGGWGVGDG